MPGKRLIPHVGVQSRGDPIPYSGKGKAVLSIPATGRDTHSCLSSTLLFLIQLSDMQFPKDLPAGIRSRVDSQLLMLDIRDMLEKDKLFQFR